VVAREVLPTIIPSEPEKEIDRIVKDHANPRRLENKRFPGDREVYGFFSENSLV